MTNVPMILRRIMDKLIERLGMYRDRTIRYAGFFTQFIGSEGVVLDIGCGSGIFSKLLAKGERMVIALDIQEDFLRRMESTNINIHKVCADAHYLPFRDDSVDYVLSISLIEHLRKPEMHIVDVYRVLRKKAVWIIQLPNLQYLIEPHTKWPLLYLMPKQLQLKILELSKCPDVNMKVVAKYVLELLHKTGFEIVMIKKVYHVSIMKLIPIAPSLIFVARKT
ncbi:MAG: class I SAM-dependent methyltransferase [Desulfurococcaceae archaeon]